MLVRPFYQFVILSVAFFLVVGATDAEPNSESGYAVKPRGVKKIRVDIYYESLCPACKAEYGQLPALVQKVGAYLDLVTYPFGNARMHNENGITVVKCQHGDAECYGNKLHACAMEYLQYNIFSYVPYNACMMGRGDDIIADYCAQLVGINAKPIKDCAKSQHGHDLLVYYGTLTPKDMPYVPYVFVNGALLPISWTLEKAVCQAMGPGSLACN